MSVVAQTPPGAFWVGYPRFSITHVEIKPEYTLAITFDDGTSGEISIKNRLFGPVFEPLKDPDFFAQAQVDEFGAVFWPNNADLAPDALYRRLTEH